MRRWARFLVLVGVALTLSACVGADVDWRGWRVRAGAALPLGAPAFDGRYTQQNECVASTDMYDGEPRCVVRAATRQRPDVRYVRVPGPVRVIHRTETRTRTVRRDCRPPRKLMRADPFYDDNYVHKVRALQRYIREHCNR